MQGKGVLMFKDGTYFEGDFMDKPHGKGVTTLLFR
jgi:hypothetical protein